MNSSQFRCIGDSLHMGKNAWRMSGSRTFDGVGALMKSRKNTKVVCRRIVVWCELALLDSEAAAGGVTGFQSSARADNNQYCHCHQMMMGRERERERKRDCHYCHCYRLDSIT